MQHHNCVTYNKNTLVLKCLQYYGVLLKIHTNIVFINIYQLVILIKKRNIFNTFVLENIWLKFIYTIKMQKCATSDFLKFLLFIPLEVIFLFSDTILLNIFATYFSASKWLPTA